MDKNASENVVSNRRARLRELISTYGSQADFVAKSGQSQSEVSGMVNGTKAFGEKKARKIEMQCGLPMGWLDQDIDGSAPSAPVTSPAPIPSHDRPRLIMATQREQDLLEKFRLSTEDGKLLLEDVAASTEKADVQNVIAHFERGRPLR